MTLKSAGAATKNNLMATTTNPQLELAYEYVCHTDKSLFLTGKAGTGKTTFLHRLREAPPKRLAVVAPTGVAAINAGGMTIHSLFQLPFGPLVPGNKRDASRLRRFSRKKINLIRSLDLLIIDEISMVRADLLDGVDEVLRRYRMPHRPFGGVQLLLIGDLHQLPPVVKDQDWDMLRDYYATPYFFSSRALQEAEPVTIQLTHIYRQSDPTFIELLNRVRNNNLDDTVLAALNSRYRPASEIKTEDAYITLTTHNATARSLNNRQLAALDEKAYTFQAVIEGDFPAHAYPADVELTLKRGAQVMFIKNDPAPEKEYYNGKIGKVTQVDNKKIRVKCPGDPEPITVPLTEWANRKYALDEQTKEVSEQIVGTFTQYPLRLAWAITIHKSQGLTFERVILDAEAAFAHGQVYVALSRCKTFEGIVLRSRIHSSSVRTDAKVRQFSEEAERQAPGPAQLEQAKVEYQQSVLLELFAFGGLRRRCERLQRVLLEHESKLLPGATEPFDEVFEAVQSHILPVAEKFRRQLRSHFQNGLLPENNETLQARVRKAAAWFAEQFSEKLTPAARRIQIISDNQQVHKAATDALTELRQSLFVKTAVLRVAKQGFSAHGYLRAKADAELDFREDRKQKAVAPPADLTPQTISHPDLYRRLTQWRAEQAKSREVAHYQILPTRTLLAAAEGLPAGAEQLQQLPGIGSRRLETYGADLLALVHAYCEENGLQPATELPFAAPPPQKAPKPDTKAVTLELYRAGKTVTEIAEARGLAVTTIEGHIAHHVQAGTVDVADFMDTEAITEIAERLADVTEKPLTALKAHFGDRFSYGQLRMVMAHVAREEE